MAVPSQIHPCTQQDHQYRTSLEYGHALDWENISLLDSEPCFQKRLMSEMIFIKKQTKAINIQNDTERLSEAYFSLLNITSSI